MVVAQPDSSDSSDSSDSLTSLTHLTRLTLSGILRKDGGPMQDNNLYKLFVSATFRLTGQKTNPHLVRDSIVTYLR